MRFLRTPTGGVEITISPADRWDKAIELSAKEWDELVWRLATEVPRDDVIEGQVVTAPGPEDQGMSPQASEAPLGLISRPELNRETETVGDPVVVPAKAQVALDRLLAEGRVLVVTFL